MLSVLITGGAGDWASSFKEQHLQRFDITTVSRKELDVSSPEAVANFFADKSFDVVINNAGSIHPARFADADPHKWINDINVNLIGTFLVSQAAVKAKPDTQIINISSTAAFNAYGNWSSYCSAKAGVLTLSKSLANDGYEAYCVCPGAIDTKFRDGLNLSNANAMTCEHLSTYIVDIVDGKYQSGDVLFIRKDEFVLNP
jgi:3-oxoacyl-[acyl-carrier protein] reductase